MNTMQKLRNFQVQNNSNTNKTATFINIGERTNVAGSAKFARLIREKNYDEAAQIAKNQIENGASIIDINFDDAMLNSAEEMQCFVRYISNDADIAKAALMIDSSDWQTILAGLKNFQGKSIVNSISLKEGEEVFLQHAREIQRLGATVVVMAFDENGQAATFERKIEICRRAYYLLTQKLDFQPYNIIFDVNVLTIGTGIDEHNNYAVDFIRAVKWVKETLPFALTSGGISNLSFSFRGNNAIREAMHSVFLYHAINAGLDMGIVNPAMLQIYDDIEPVLLQKVENVVLNKTQNATEELLEYAENIKNTNYTNSHKYSQENNNICVDLRNLCNLRSEKTIENRLADALRYGNSEFLADDLREALQKYSSAVEIIEKPLMSAMDKVGELFGEGKMFLPQVIKSAKVMKTAIEILQPEIERQKSAENSLVKRPKIVIATAKGDIHDIGKNILCIMLACNNFEVIDLGIMVENQVIIDAIKLHKPDFVGVSALITPSLSEMADLCQILENEGFKLPFFVGGAAASAVHTAVKLAPVYSFGVFYGGNASSAATLMKRYLQNQQEIILQNSENQKISTEKYQNRKENILTFQQAQSNKPVFVKESFLQNNNFGQENLFSNNVNISILDNYINWKEFLHFWQVSPAQENENYAQSLINEAKTILKTEQENFKVSYIVKFFNAYSADNQIILSKEHVISSDNEKSTENQQISRFTRNDGEAVLPMLRSQSPGSENLCLADYFPDKSLNISTKIGLFCITANHNNLPVDEKSFEYLVRKTLCARLVEAVSQYIQQQLFENQKLIAPAFGYAVCPDHSLKRDVFDLLDAENQICVQLSETYGISPSTSICGMLISHQNAKYFNILNIDNEQFTHYCKQRNFSEEQMKRLIGHLL